MDSNTALAQEMSMDKTYSLYDYYAEAGLQDPPTWAKEIPVTLPSGATPSQFQVQNLNRILRNSSWGFFDQAGTGKTIPAQAYAIYMASHGYRVIAVMPPVLRKQFVRSMRTTLPGSERVVSAHVLDQDPVPMRVTKQRVQAVKRALYKSEPVPDGVLKRDIDLISKLKRATPLYFTEKEIEGIRRNDQGLKIKDLATVYGCSQAAISKIRNTTFREDLFSKWEQEDSWPDLLVMSYQMFTKVVAIVEEAYQCLIADEAHALCHPTSTQHRKVRWFLEKRDRTFLPMTGTPSPNLPTDAYGIIKLLNPAAYSNFSNFKSMHVDSYVANDRFGRRMEIVNGYRNLDYMSQCLYARGSRVTLDQVLTLDKPTIIEEPIELSEQHRDLYKKLVKTRLLVSDSEYFSASEAQTLRQRALQLIINPDVYSDEKIKDHEVKNWIVQKLDSLGTEHLEKVVIYAQFNKSVEKLSEWFSHLNPALVYGKSNTQKNVNKFLTDESCRLMIAHPKSGGVGVDQLQTLCRYIIFIEPTAVPGDFDQALGRLVRRGQKRAVVCYIPRVMRTPWPKRVDEMRRKMKLISDVTLDRTDLLKELLGD